MNQFESETKLNYAIAENLKSIRKSKNMSLSEVSERTGVSKSMLGQIERGESSPTISTLWKIATGLDIPFTSLMDHKKSGIEIVHEDVMTPITNDHGHFRLFSIFPASSDKSFELIDLVMDPGSLSESPAHSPGTEEYGFVYEGCFEFNIDGEKYEVSAGSAIHYQADKPHSYRNIFSGISRASMIINYRNADDPKAVSILEEMKDEK